MQAVILAAGESSRFWPLNYQHKSLLKIMGRPLICYLLDELKKAGIKEIVIVQRPERDIEKELKNYSYEIDYVVQPEPKGMGDALWQAKPILKGPFIVLNAEIVNCQSIIKDLIRRYQKGAPKAIIVGQKTKTPQLFGMLKLEGKRVLGIVEKPKPGREPSNIKTVVIDLLTPEFFLTYEKVPKEQYDFEKALSAYARKVETEVLVVKGKEEEGPSFLKYPHQLFAIERFLLSRFLVPKISKTTKISPKAIIEGQVFIGENTTVFENAVIKGPCYIGDNCLIGSHSLVRENVNLENNVVIGASAEVTRSVFQEGSPTRSGFFGSTHSGYFGDSIIGSNCHFGSGVITANFRLDEKNILITVKNRKIDTGSPRLGVIVGRNSYFGLHSSTMPGVFIGSDCIIGPGTIVFKNVPDNSKVITKFQTQILKSKKT
ncbi:MAG: sugar phosphate nucleotidyltransferase [bacterium]|nr:sugar phosphate nucleotidyltransferase [bacterium]